MKNFSIMKPREVEAYLREQVRKIFGDAAENHALIWSSHGYYHVEFNFEHHGAAFSNFRKAGVPKIVKAMRALK